MAKDRHISGRSTSQTIGFVLWRGGLYFSGGYATFVSVRWFLRVVLALGVPAPILIGISLFLAGGLLVLASILVEQILDTRAEKSLRDP